MTPSQYTPGETLDQAACEWIIRTELCGTQKDWAELDTWLAASPLHRAAYLRHAAIWKSTERLKDFWPASAVADRNLLEISGADAADDAPLRVPAASRVARLRQLLCPPSPKAAACAAILAMAAGGMSWGLGRSPEQTYSTDVGGLARILLDDGSIVTLNTDSEIRVSITKESRHVSLVRGEALFKVATDVHRPFRMEAAGTTIHAGDTIFSARLAGERDKNQVEVLVSAGGVMIETPSPARYTAGSVVRVRSDAVFQASMDVADISTKLGWIAGRLTFVNTKLSDVVTEFNRYNRRQLVIVDPTVADRKVNGTFSATDPEELVRALKNEGIEGSRVTRRSAQEIQLKSEMSFEHSV